MPRPKKEMDHKRCRPKMEMEQKMPSLEIKKALNTL
jgi:hypothetical protein